MARYCFYCGRELKEGERCNCRAAAKLAAQKEQASDPKLNEQSQATGSTTREPDATSTQSSSTSAYSDASASARANSANDAGAKRKRKRRNKASSAFNGFKEKFSNFNKGGAKRKAQNFGNEAGSFFRQIPRLLRDLVTAPDRIVELGRTASTQWVFITLILELFIVTLVLALTANHSTLGRFLTFSLNQIEQPMRSGGSLWPRILLIHAVAYGLRLLLYLLALKLNFISSTVRNAAIQAVPASLYFSFVFFFGIFFIRSSGVQVLFIAMLAWGIRLLIDAKVMKDIAGVRSDRLFLTIMGVYFVMFMGIAMIISLVLPEVTRIQIPRVPTLFQSMAWLRAI